MKGLDDAAAPEEVAQQDGSPAWRRGDADTSRPLDGARAGIGDAAAGARVESVVGLGASASGASAAGAAALRVRGLTFTYPAALAPVLHDVSLEVPQGAFVLLVGGTGSGKSTLLSLVKPEIAPSGACAGAIEVFGRSVGELDARSSARTVGFVFQNPDNQIVCDSVWHEMAFGLENLGTPQAEMRRLVAETSYFFGMEEWFRQRTDTLSGGRKQLLALASTLVMQPRMLLLDEPTAQLDPVAEKNFLHALFRVNRELGCTVVVATHAPRAMVDYATAAYRLQDGGVRAVEDLDELRVVEPLRSVPASASEPGVCGEGSACAGRGTFAAVSKLGAEEGDSRGAEAGAPAATCCASETSGPLASARDVRHKAAYAPAGTVPAGSAATVPVEPATDVPAHPAVEVERVWFRYERDSAWVLRGFGARFAAGAAHALVGGNGCGKTTLLQMAAGVLTPRRGAVRVDARSRALLPQDPRALFAAESVADELMEWSSAGYGRAEVSSMLARLGLAGREALHPYDLSGGQQQLLALGKLLLVRPELLLLDEPTKGLDAHARFLVARAIEEACAAGSTVIFASHDLDFVQQVAQTVSMMFDGELACTEPTASFFMHNVYYRP
mgnify:FL=1